MKHTGKSDQCEVVREGRMVSVHIRCKDDYAAMMFYDKIIDGLAKGSIEISLEKRRVE